MLLGLDPLLTPDLLHALASMGHGDEIALVDANFPAAAFARRLIRLDGVDGNALLSAVLSVLPLDNFVERPVSTMQVVGEPDAIPPTVADYLEILGAAGSTTPIDPLDRFDFYDRAQNAYAIVITGERRPYGNILLRKGVVFD
ncbi:transporter [Aliidongia dinghuensis]|uniref:Transporter n=1 Tax=Aliidongia dinghuensis TaxID=1867774 RepID=A0A8J2YVW0_9PROT|nr:RbsD/FucU domain-containing protein [Aliidongia dinghuensis]GGF29323.1 transporter [Aliidongia dinghuensis]